MITDEYTQYKPRMTPNAPDKLNVKRTIYLSLAFTTVLLAWSYFNFKVPRLLDVLIPDGPSKQTLKGFIMAMDNLVAVILQPFFGNLSDRTQSKWGRRIPFIILGTCLSAFFFIILPWVEFLAGFILIVLLFDCAMSFYRAVSIAILPDYTPDSVRSKASALQQFIANMGGVVGFAVPIIVGVFTGLNEDWQRGVGFLLVGIIMLVLLIIQLIAIKETPTSSRVFQVGKHEIAINNIDFTVSEKIPSVEAPKINIYQEIGGLFKLPEKSILYMFLVVFFAYFAFAGIEAFFSSFAQVYLGKSDSVSGTLFLAYSVPMILTAPIWGILGQKWGRRKAAIFGLLGIVIATGVMGLLLVPLMYNPKPLSDLETNITTANILLMLNLACISMPWMCFIVNSFPIIWNLSPEGKIGSYTGIYYAFNQLAYTLAPVLVGVILDAFAFLGSYQYIVMFPVLLMCVCISVIIMFKVKRGDVDLKKTSS